MLDVVILAGGQGMRMRPLTFDRPKSMIAIAGQPLIQHLMTDLQTLGVKRAIVVVGHGSDQVQTFLGDGSRFGMQITFVRQAKQLGPGHALMQARPHVTGEEFLMIPADAWYSVDKLRSLLGSDGPTLIRVPTHRSQRHGIPVVKAGKVIDLEASADASARASGGAYRLHRRIFDLLESHEHRLVDAIRADVRHSGAWTAVDAAEQSYVDIVGVQDILDLHQLLLERLEPAIEGVVEPGAVLQGTVRLGKGSTIRTGTVVRGPVRIGENCDVGPMAVLQPGTALRNHVRVQPFAVLAECVIGSNVEVGSHVRITRAYVDRGARLDSGVHVRAGAGTIIGADAHLEADACVPSDGVIGHAARVAAGRTVQTVPDLGWAV